MKEEKNLDNKIEEKVENVVEKELKKQLKKPVVETEFSDLRKKCLEDYDFKKYNDLECYEHIKYIRKLVQEYYLKKVEDNYYDINSEIIRIKEKIESMEKDNISNLILAAIISSTFALAVSILFNQQINILDVIIGFVSVIIVFTFAILLGAFISKKSIAKYRNVKLFYMICLDIIINIKN